MASATHETIKLSPGKHRSPDEGACVMELASMLAGEPFSDHPASVCPVIAALMRAYNDALDDKRRQHLYVYASKVVGSRGSRAVERMRTERLTAWAAEVERRRFARSLFPVRLRRLAPRPPVHVAAARAVRAVGIPRDRTQDQVLTFVDELLAIGVPLAAPSAPSAWSESRDGHAGASASSAR
jgi:hypothetical protein